MRYQLTVLNQLPAELSVMDTTEGVGSDILTLEVIAHKGDVIEYDTHHRCIRLKVRRDEVKRLGRSL